MLANVKKLINLELEIQPENSKNRKMFEVGSPVWKILKKVFGLFWQKADLTKNLIRKMEMADFPVNWRRKKKAALLKSIMNLKSQREKKAWIDGKRKVSQSNQKSNQYKGQMNAILVTD